jgi:fumarate reductase subunit C
MTQEEAWATLDVVASALLLYHLLVYMLFDPRATHFFVVSKKVGKSSCRVEKGFTISTLLRENIDIYMVYMSMKLDVMGV